MHIHSGVRTPTSAAALTHELDVQMGVCWLQWTDFPRTLRSMKRSFMGMQTGYTLMKPHGSKTGSDFRTKKVFPSLPELALLFFFF